MKSSIFLVTAAFLCLVAFPTTTVGKNLKFWPKPIEGWPNPSDISRNEMFMSTSQKFNYGDSKVWKCTYSNGSAPAISISPSIPSTPSTPTPSTPSPSPLTPKTSPPPTTPSPQPPTPKKSPLPPTPSLPPPTPKKSPSPSKPTPSLPPPTPKKSPFPSPPSDDESSSPSQPLNPPPEHHHSHHHENPWEHFGSCMRNMGPVGVCRGQMEFSFITKMFQVSKYCCDLIVDMKNECDDVIWGYFTDPFFVPLVRCTCHVTY